LIDGLAEAKPVAVPKPRIAIIAVVSIAVLCFAVAVGTAKHAPALSARVVEVVHTGYPLEVRVQVTNNSDYVYSPVIARMEVWTGKSWETYRNFSGDLSVSYGELSVSHNVPRRATDEINCFIDRSKPGERLRVVIEGYRTRSGLRSFLFRLRRRLLGGDQSIALNPLDPTPIIYVDTVAVTDEFRAP
jgi:hypothetical protein